MRFKKRVRSLMCGICSRTLRCVEHRIFYAIFQLTRVSNDHYGWRPKEK